MLETDRDITERKRAQEAVEQAKQHAENTAIQLRSVVVKNMAERLCVCDSHGQPILTNEAFRKTYRGTAGISAVFLGDTGSFRYGRQPRPGAYFPVSRALRGEKIHGLELRLRLKHSGEEMINRYNASPVRDSAGNVAMAVFTSENITERKRNEAQLFKSNRALTAYSHSTQALLHAESEPGSTGPDMPDCDRRLWL